MKKSKLFLLCGVIALSLTAHSAKAVNFYDTIGTKYEGAAERLAELEMISGTSKGVFSPDKLVTRAEFAKMIVGCAYNNAEQNALAVDDTNFYFKDVDKTAWYYKYVTIAVNGNLMNGYEDRTFRPEQNVTYSEIAKMVTKALGHAYLSENDPRGWDAEYLDKAYSELLFKYTEFDDPHQKATRGDVVNILWNTLKAHRWEMIYRNDVSGFSYVDSGTTLFTSKIIDHTYLLDAKIQGYYEFDGKKYVQLNGGYYKLFDQSAKVNFSSIGGTSDILFKRVEYPGEVVRYEVIGISTDIGSQLYAGTLKELQSDDFKLINKKTMSEKADYAYLYHYEDKPENDRVIALNLANTYVIDEIKIDDKKPEEKKGSEEEQKKSHSYPANKFVKDQIAYRYDSEDSTFFRTITINGGEAVIMDGAVLFKDNEKVDWGSVQKGDVIIEVTPNRYYFVQTGKHTEDVTLLSYSTKKGDYWIETSKGKYSAYVTTRFQDYTSESFKDFYSLKSSVLENLIGKEVRITTDISDRVIKIELLTDDISFSDLKIGFFDSFNYQDKGDNVVRILVDGKTKFFYTKLESINVNKGDLVKYEFEEGSTKYIKSISAVKGDVKVADKIKLEAIKTDKLLDTLKYYEDNEIDIYKSTYIYDFAKYEKPASYKVETMKIADVEDLPIKNEEISCYLLLDSEEVLRKVIITDNRQVNDIYYGTVSKLYRDKEEKQEHIVIKMVGGKEKDYTYKDTLICKEGDFIKYKLLDEKSISFIESFEAKDLGYYKDFIVKSEDKDSKGVIGYKLKDGNYINLSDWTIESDEIIRLSGLEVFVVKVEKTKSGEWQMVSSSRMTNEKPNFQIGDRIAINEIEGTAVVYRGYED